MKYTITISLFLILGITTSLFAEAKKTIGKLNVEELISSFKKYDSEKRETVESIEKTLNLEYMARRALNLYWEKASEEERVEYISLFKKLTEKLAFTKTRDYFLENRYSISGEEKKVKKDFGITSNREEIEILSVHIQVDVKLRTGIKQEEVVFHLTESPTGWIVFDIELLEGSLIRDYRNQFSRIIRTKGGIKKLLENLRNKLSELS